MDALAFDNDKHRARVNFNNSAILLDDIGNTQVIKGVEGGMVKIPTHARLAQTGRSGQRDHTQGTTHVLGAKYYMGIALTGQDVNRARGRLDTNGQCLHACKNTKNAQLVVDPTASNTSRDNTGNPEFDRMTGEPGKSQTQVGIVLVHRKTKLLRGSCSYICQGFKTQRVPVSHKNVDMQACTHAGVCPRVAGNNKGAPLSAVPEELRRRSLGGTADNQSGARHTRTSRRNSRCRDLNLRDGNMGPQGRHMVERAVSLPQVKTRAQARREVILRPADGLFNRQAICQEARDGT